MDVTDYIWHPFITIKGTLTAPQKEMVVVEVELPMTLQVLMDATRILPLVDIMVITVTQWW